jgi:hypothetical protein
VLLYLFKITFGITFLILILEEIDTGNGFLQIPIQEEFEDTKGAIRIRISKKNRQHNGQ